MMSRQPRRRWSNQTPTSWSCVTNMPLPKPPSASAAPAGATTAYYVPLDDGDAAVTSVCEKLLADPAIGLRGYDLKRELLAWSRRGVYVTGMRFDALLAAYLTNQRLRVPSLPVLAQDLCNIRLDGEEELLGKGRTKRTLRDVP